MRIIWFIVILILSNVYAFAQSSKSQREKSGFQLIRDSASSYIRLDYLKVRPFSLWDSLFIYSDTSCIFYYSYGDSINRKMNCYNNFDNYIYRSEGKKLSKQFLTYKRKKADVDSVFSWDLMSFTRNDKRFDFFDSVRLKHFPGNSWISYPYFNRSRRTMILEYGEVCGQLCGYGVTLVYVFKKGRWVFRRKIVEWVS